MNIWEILQVVQKRKRNKVFTQTGWIWAATACTGRDIAGQRTGPGPASRARPLGGHVEGGFAGVCLRAEEADPAEAVST